MQQAAIAAAVERIAAATSQCRLCPKDCGVDRMASSEGARCGLGSEAWVYKELLSQGEEAAICPTWLLDLGGCSMRCRFCSEWAHVVRPHTPPAVRLDPTWFASALARKRAAGARTISFVGGDPTVSLLGVLRALATVEANALLPVVWNCNGQVGDDAFAELAPLVSCWVIDLKFANDNCAQRLAGPEERNYGRHVAATLDRVQALPASAEAWPRLLIRHLLMPGHLHCCTLPVIEAVARRWPSATFNLMTTYLPFGPALKGVVDAPELSGLNRQADRDTAIAWLLKTAPLSLIDGGPARS